MGENSIAVVADIVFRVQDDTLAAQAALEKQMSAVGDDVDDTRSKVDEVSMLV